MSPISSTLAGASARGYGGLGSSVVAAEVGDYQSIASYELTSESTISFISIPKTFTHLQIRAYSRNTSTSNNIRMEFNGDTTNGNYYSRATFGGGSMSGWTQNYPWVNYGLESNSAGNYMANKIIDIFNYKNTDKVKISQVLGGYALAADGYAWFQTHTWNSTSAITDIVLKAEGSPANFGTSSQFALYGIK